MGKYLKTFDNHNGYQAFIGGGGRYPIHKA